MRLLALLTVALMAAGGCLDDVLPGNGRVDAMDIVSAKDYTKWVIEVDYARGHKPSQELLDFLHGRVAPVVDKPQGVELRYSQELTDSGGRAWSAQALGDYAKGVRTVPTEGDTVVLHLLFVEGHHEADSDDARVLGVAIDHDLVAIFVESMDKLCENILPIPGTCSTAPYYRSVVLHEIGHAMGLVDNGLPMVRDHEAGECMGRADEGHSSNQDSVMYCGVEQSIQILGFGANPPTNFDADDRADLQAARSA